MRLKELIQLLESLPESGELFVFYKDGNFGGRSEEFTAADITVEDGTVLIRSPYWQDCNEDSHA